MRFVNPLVITLALALTASAALAADRAIVLQSTTSTANSGLYDAILPAFTQRSGIRVHVVAVGTGQAIKNAKNGDGDVLLVHAKSAEEQFVADGYGVERFDVMYNDFVIVGPPGDPAKVRGMTDAPAALAKIAAAETPFASRGDDSGTHKKEVSLWSKAGVDAAAASGRWYRETGSGMGATLNIAVGMGAYTMSDRGTWISFKNKRDYKILLAGDTALFSSLRRLGPRRSAVLFATHAPFAALLGFWLLDESLSARTLAGCALVGGSDVAYASDQARFVSRYRFPFSALARAVCSVSWCFSRNR